MYGVSLQQIRKWTLDLVTFTEEILNGKLHFCAVEFSRCIYVFCVFMYDT